MVISLKLNDIPNLKSEISLKIFRPTILFYHESDWKSNSLNCFRRKITDSPSTIRQLKLFYCNYSVNASIL